MAFLYLIFEVSVCGYVGSDVIKLLLHGEELCVDGLQLLEKSNTNLSISTFPPKLLKLKKVSELEGLCLV